MKRTTAVIGSVALAAALLIAPSAQAATATSVSTAKSDYSKAKQNRFWRMVSTYEPSVKIAGKQSTVELGIATCDLLRAGGDLTLA